MNAIINQPLRISARAPPYTSSQTEVPNSTQLLKKHYKFILCIKTNRRHVFVGDSVLSACRSRYVACMAVEIAMTDLREARINTRSISLHLNFVICIPSHLLAFNTFASFIFVPCTSYFLYLSFLPYLSLPPPRIPHSPLTLFHLMLPSALTLWSLWVDTLYFCLTLSFFHVF